MLDLDEAFLCRFFAKIVKNDEGCWGWTAATGHFGYGQIWIKSRHTMWDAHRVMWLIEFGEIPDGKCVLHSCDNPPCTRPSHLYLGTKKNNADDRSSRKRHWIHRDPEAARRHLLSIAGNGKSPGTPKLTPDQVRMIRNTGENCSSLARLFGVDPETVRLCRNRVTWKELA